MDECVNHSIRFDGGDGDCKFSIRGNMFSVEILSSHAHGGTANVSIDDAALLRDWLTAHLPFTLHLEGDEQPVPYSAERLTPSQVAEQAKQWFATQDDMEAKHG